ncbi:hypothetical protein [Rhodococcus wratislaviensis]|uniref:hypothetical protein n=1 Tax=Rhodococcus wratislaviensis TaxID=44752 RepID=UPI001FEC824C|nr:hypothetical protein [Rhodococcus wratislaviensis]
MQLLSRKTGTPALIIERFLDDVAYCLELEDMREEVLSVVERRPRDRPDRRWCTVDRDDVPDPFSGAGSRLRRAGHTAVVATPRWHGDAALT